MKWLLVLCLAASARAGGDSGPGDPEFSANDGDLESDVNPIDAPQVGKQFELFGMVVILHLQYINRMSEFEI